MILLRLLSLLTVVGLLGPSCSASDSAAAADPSVLVATTKGFEPPAWDGVSPLIVRNEHEVAVSVRFYRMTPGADTDAFIRYLAGDHPGVAPFEVVADVERVEPGHEVVVDDDLDAGDYVIASLAPDADAGWVPQFLTGHLADLVVG